MKLNCIHCGGAFSVRHEQFGAAVACPHCRAVVKLPKADEDIPQEEESAVHEPSGAMKNSISALTSLVIHVLLFIALALVTLGDRGLPGEGEDVLIGVLPGETLSQNQDESLDTSAEAEDRRDPADEALEDLEIAPPSETTDPTALQELALNPTSLSGSSSTSFDLGMIGAGGGSDGGSWDGMLQRLRRNGLDVVIVFDSTGSMGGEIHTVKQQIKRIGNSLLTLVPKARISLVTYRDYGDEYVVKEPILPLTSDIQLVEEYLAPIRASGGGDIPEAVHAGLEAAVAHNEFRPSARKVILVFGDAPPHARFHATCLRIASDFNRQQRGVVSTITCRSQVPLKEFVEIAQVGGGEAFLTSDERQVMTQLMILVFGSQYRGKVVEAFELMER